MSVIIIGGGIAGMEVARLLAGSERVTLIAAPTDMDGLNGSFRLPCGATVDKFHLPFSSEDAELLALVAELGLDAQIRMGPRSLSLLHRGERFPFTTLLEAVRFRPLGTVQKLKFVLACARLRDRNAALVKKLDGTPVAAWLRAVMGAGGADVVARPLLERRFGAAWPDLPVLWMIDALARQFPHRSTRSGALAGGLGLLAEALRSRLVDLGVEIVPQLQIQRLEVDRDVTVVGEDDRLAARRVVIGLPVGRAQQLLHAGGAKTCIDSTAYEHATPITGTFLLREPLGSSQYAAVVEAPVAFHTIVDHGALGPYRGLSGTHLIQVIASGHPSSPLFQASPETIASEFRRGLRTLFPALPEDGILDGWVFSAPDAEPVFSTGFSDRKPPLELIGSRVYLLNDAQAYPSVPSLNTRIALARRIAERIAARRRLECSEMSERAREPLSVAPQESRR